jgi:hypothetical protein
MYANNVKNFTNAAPLYYFSLKMAFWDQNIWEMDM